MRIKINDSEYTVSMKWEQDDSISYFVHVDNDVHELDIRACQLNDGKTYLTSDKFRGILAQHIQKVLNDCSCNRRAGLC